MIEIFNNGELDKYDHPSIYLKYTDDSDGKVYYSRPGDADLNQEPVVVKEFKIPKPGDIIEVIPDKLEFESAFCTYATIEKRRILRDSKYTLKVSKELDTEGEFLFDGEVFSVAWFKLIPKDSPIEYGSEEYLRMSPLDLYNTPRKYPSACKIEVQETPILISSNKKLLLLLLK